MTIKRDAGIPPAGRLSRRLVLALLGACALPARADGGEERPGLDAAESQGFAPIAAGVRAATSLVLYEGLPHPAWEAEAFKRELAMKETVRWDKYVFYATPLPVAAQDVEPLRRLSAAAASYWSYGGPKLCGGYHPDYRLTWQASAANADLLVCFGCHEMRLYGAGHSLIVDLRPQADTEFAALLGGYRRERPPRQR